MAVVLGKGSDRFGMARGVPLGRGRTGTARGVLLGRGSFATPARTLVGNSSRTPGTETVFMGAGDPSTTGTTAAAARARNEWEICILASESVVFEKLTDEFQGQI
jgi:hypothetical protein